MTADEIAQVKDMKDAQAHRLARLDALVRTAREYGETNYMWMQKGGHELALVREQAWHAMKEKLLACQEDVTDA